MFDAAASPPLSPCEKSYGKNKRCPLFEACKLGLACRAFEQYCNGDDDAEFMGGVKEQLDKEEKEKAQDDDLAEETIVEIKDEEFIGKDLPTSALYSAIMKNEGHRKMNTKPTLEEFSRQLSDAQEKGDDELKIDEEKFDLVAIAFGATVVRKPRFTRHFIVEGVKVIPRYFEIRKEGDRCEGNQQPS